MRNQGRALNRARRKSQRCRPSLQRGWRSDATRVCFLPFVWSAKMEESVTLNRMRYASDDSPCSHYCAAVCLIQFVCELSPYYQMWPKFIFSYWAFSHDQKPSHQSVLITALLVMTSQRKYSLLLLWKIDLWTDQTTDRQTDKIFRQSVVKNKSGAKCLWLNNSVCWLQSSDVDCGPVFWISRRSPWPVTPLMGYLLMNRWWEETNTVMVYWAPDNCLYCCSSHFVWTTVWWFGRNRATPGEKQPENIHFLC